MRPLKPTKVFVVEQVNLGSSAILLVTSEKKAKHRKIVRQASLSDLKGLRSGSDLCFFAQTSDGVFVSDYRSDYRSLNEGEVFFPPLVSRIANMRLVSNFVSLKSIVNLKYEETGPGWIVRFSDGEREFEISVFFDCSEKQWDFELLAPSSEQFCPFCASSHAMSKKCRFLHDENVVQAVGAQLLQNAGFWEEARKSAGQWRLKAALKGAFGTKKRLI